MSAMCKFSFFLILSSVRKIGGALEDVAERRTLHSCFKKAVTTFPDSSNLQPVHFKVSPDFKHRTDAF
jgi:hypothetical protein